MYYKLVDKEPVRVDTLNEALTSPDKVVRKDKKASVIVSTVFLGMDHNFRTGKPLLFETMIFGGPNAGYQERCSTWDEAEAQHEVACEVAGIVRGDYDREG